MTWVDPIILALVVMLGGDNYRARQTAHRVLAETPQARLALTLGMGRNAETMNRGEQLIKVWDEAATPHPKAGYTYKAHAKGEVWEIGIVETTVNVLWIEADWVRCVVHEPEDCYWRDWMQRDRWEWTVIERTK